jgi:hypothetical protein
MWVLSANFFGIVPALIPANYSASISGYPKRMHERGSVFGSLPTTSAKLLLASKFALGIGAMP